MLKYLHSLFILFFMTFLTSCGLFFGSNEVDNKSHDYSYYQLHLEPNSPWIFLPNPRESGGDLAFENEKTQAIISLNSVCREFKDATLEDLLQNLLMGLEIQGAMQSKKIKLDGANAIDSTLVTESPDGEPLRIRAVVVKKELCTYDFMYISRPETFNDGQVSFQRFLKGFRANE